MLSKESLIVTSFLSFVIEQNRGWKDDKVRIMTLPRRDQRLQLLRIDSTNT